MDDITTRTIVIAVNIFVTITIVSLVAIMFFQMREIYGVVATTDTSIYNKFDDVYSMYHGKVETGIGLLNALKKYEDNNDRQITIKYNGSDKIRENLGQDEREAQVLKELMKKNETKYGTTFRYEDKYDVIVIDGENESIIIEFSKR